MPEIQVPAEPASPGHESHEMFRTGLWQYVRNSRWAVAVTAPLIYICLIPFALLDLTVTIYHAVCFPLYGIPKLRRSDHMKFDRAKLRYLNGLERLNCLYCSYANGLVSYVGEVAARTEQHWCPIQHRNDPAFPHSRYGKFLPYGDARGYRDRIEQVRNGFEDLRGDRRA